MTGSEYLCLYSKENVPEKQKSRLRRLSRQNLNTAQAWAIKESFRQLWGYTRLAWAAGHFKA